VLVFVIITYIRCPDITIKFLISSDNTFEFFM
jgi:hypothetical protein